MEESESKSINEKIQNISNRSQEFRTKFTYYILAVDAACIGFSVNYNKEANYSWHLLPFIVAVICWLTSFLFGIIELQIADSLLITNIRLLDAYRRENQKAINTHDEVFDKKEERRIRLADLKIWALYGGGVSFILWYFLKILKNC